MAAVEQSMLAVNALGPGAVTVSANPCQRRPSKWQDWASACHVQGRVCRLTSTEGATLCSNSVQAARRPQNAANGRHALSARTSWKGGWASTSCRALKPALARPATAGFFCLCGPSLKAGVEFSSAGRKQRSKVDLLVVHVGSPVEEAEVQDAEKDFSGGAGNGDDGEGGGRGNGDEGGVLGFVSNGILIVLWAGLIYYAAAVAPGQTPYRDQYFLEKLCGLRRDDGFSMNPVLVDVFYIMGLWPAIYTALLIPSGRSSKGGLPVWPFTVASTFVGVFGLLPYFALWKPPVPTVPRKERETFPFKVLESKIFAAVLAISMAGLLVNAALCPPEDWKEYLQYFRGSKFIHVMSIDFVALSLLAPFWVYNDLGVREGLDKKLWLVPLALLPGIGPALHLLLRPSLPSNMVED